MIDLHKSATITAAVREQVQQSSASELELAEHHSISRTTVQRLEHWDSADDRSHTPYRPRTTLNAGQEEYKKSLLSFMSNQHHQNGPAEFRAGGSCGRLVPMRDTKASAKVIVAALAAPLYKAALPLRAGEFSVHRAVESYPVLPVRQSNSLARKHAS
jgi:hypothetical protein